MAVCRILKIYTFRLNSGEGETRAAHLDMMLGQGATASQGQSQEQLVLLACKMGRFKVP